MTPLDFYHYPFSHSLLMVCLWALLFAAGYWIIRRQVRASFVLAAAVLSHWLLDLLTHRPDLPLTVSGGPLVGLGLWNHVASAVVTELAIFLGGLLLYTTYTKAADRVGSISLWSFIALLIAIYAANVFGPPPPGVNAIAVAGIVGAILFIVWSAWFDRHRVPRNSSEASVALFTEKHVGV